MRGQALKLLGFMKKEWQPKDGRLTDLLCLPERQGSLGWFMHVPGCFNDGLDIKQTPRVVTKGVTQMVWTQGSGFDFKAGDVFYDVEANGQWSEAIQKIRICVRVITATPASVKENERGRNAGSVQFEMLVPNQTRSALESRGNYALTQDDFVALLIAGEASGEEAVQRIVSRISLTTPQ